MKPSSYQNIYITSFLSLLAETVFATMATVTLTFNLKTIEAFYSIVKTKWVSSYEVLNGTQVIERKCLYI